MNIAHTNQQTFRAEEIHAKSCLQGRINDFSNTDKIYALAKKYNTPLTPRSFAVWYSYVVGDNNSVKQSINNLTKDCKSIDSYQMDNIYSEFVCDVEKGLKTQNSVSENLEKEIAEVVNLVQQYLLTNDNYTGSLGKTVDALSNEINPARILESVEALIAESTKMQSETATLSTSLQLSETQVRKMRSSLAKSRKNEMIDHLTGLSNRRRFDLTLIKEVSASQESAIPMCLAMIDIDHFKKLNDTFGHAIGDQVIQFFASLLTKNVKGRDTSARYGGEEFAIILPSTSINDARTLIEEIRRQLANTNLILKKNKVAIGKITALFGITQIRDSDNPNDIIERADANLYLAKNAGRNRTVVSD